MEFRINERNWRIIELSQDEIKEKENDQYKRRIGAEPCYDGRYFGVTYYDEQLIVLDKDLPKERKRITLMHELTHCFINCYITHQEVEYNEEIVCDIVSNSHDIISEIVDKYFRRKHDNSNTN